MIESANVGLVLSREGGGSIAKKLLKNDFDQGCLRPYIDTNGQQYITRNVGMKADGKPDMRRLVTNDATLRKDEWLAIDRAVMMAGRSRLRAWSDLAAANSYVVGNGMGTTILQTQAMSDPGSAMISMSGLQQAEGDRPHYDLTSIPLPIIHSDCDFDARQLATSRRYGQGIDVSMLEAAGRRVAEKIEELTLGTAATYSFGGGTIYGYKNYPYRQTKTITSPVAVGWTGNTLLTQILEMKQMSIDAKKYGPWRIYTAPAWDKYLDADYSAAKGDNTLRQRIKQVEGISGITTVDYLTNYDVIMVQMTSDVARAIIGMPITTLEWESHGGLQLNFKVMCIMLPQMRSDYYHNCGIIHASV